MSRLDELHRGPDRYDRADLRVKVRELRVLAPDDPILVSDVPPGRDGEVTDWRQLALDVADALSAALERLDDAERLLKERAP